MTDNPIDKFNKLIDSFADSVRPLGVDVQAAATIYRLKDQRGPFDDENAIQITMTVGETALMSLDEKEQATVDDAFAALTSGFNDLDAELQEKAERAKGEDLLKGMLDDPDWDD